MKIVLDGGSKRHVEQVKSATLFLIFSVGFFLGTLASFLLQ